MKKHTLAMDGKVKTIMFTLIGNGKERSLFLLAALAVLVVLLTFLLLSVVHGMPVTHMVDGIKVAPPIAMHKAAPTM
jgi:hypothetical protein